MDFIVSTLVNILARIGAILDNVPSLIVGRAMRYLDSFTLTTLAGGPGVWGIWAVGFANLIFDSFMEVLRQIAGAPVLAIIQEAKTHVQIPVELKSKVIRADRALFLVIDLVAQGAIEASQLSLPPLYRVWSTLDAIRSRTTSIVNNVPGVAFIRKLLTKPWQLAMQIAVVIYNYAVLGASLTIIASIIFRVGNGVLKDYTLQQRNPLVKDRSLGRRRSRVQSASNAP